MKVVRAMSHCVRRLGLGRLLLACAISTSDAQETNAPSAETPTNVPVTVAIKDNEAAASPTKGSDTNVVAAATVANTNGTATAALIDTNVVSASKPGAATTALTLDSFRLISERNIFDQSREPRSARSARSSRGSRNEEARRVPKVESFALVGTMSYAKGTFAFFDGSSSQYRKTLKVGESIGAYQVKDVAQNQVKLANEKQELELKVGQQLRREDEGDWQVSARSGDSASTSASSAASETSSSTPASGSSDAAGASDLLKRLMQQREKELNK